MKSKLFKAVLILSTVLMPLASCAPKGVKEYEISLFSSFLYPHLKELVEEKVDNVELIYEKSYYPSEQVRRLRKGHGPDLVVTNGYDEEFYTKYLVDISSSISSTLYDESIMKQISYEGKTYCLPYPGKYIGYVYNESFFEENEIETPTTNDELYEAIDKLRDLNIGIGEDDVSLSIVNNYSNNMGVFYLSLGIPDFFGTMDGAKWVSGFRNKTATMENSLDFVFDDIISPMIEKDYIDVDVLTRKRNSIDYPQRMLDGTLVATFGDSSLIYDINEKKGLANIDSKFKMLPLLSDKENHPWTAAMPSNYIGINNSISKDKQEVCLKVLEVMSSIEGQKALMEDVDGGFSYLKEDVSSIMDVPSGLEDIVDKGYVYYPKISGRIVDYLGEVTVEAMDKQISINEALAKVDDYNINGSDEVDSNFHALGIVHKNMYFSDYNVRKEETELGNLVADSVRFATGTDIAVINGGGIRSSLYEGEIFESDLHALCPYGNLVVVVTMTGDTMYQMIENGLSSLETAIPGGKFLQVSGIKYIFDSSKEVGNRLASITLENGTAIDRNKKYNVAINNYMAGNSGYDLTNGDGYTMLNIYDEKTEKGQVTLVKETTLTYYDCLLSYFNEYYDVDTKLEGRITNVSKVSLL